MSRAPSVAALLAVCLASAACVRLDHDVFHSQLPAQLSAAVQRQAREAAIPPAEDRADALLPESVVAKTLHDALVAYSSFATVVVKDARVRDRCLATEGLADVHALEQKASAVGKRRLRLGHFKAFLDALIHLRRRGEPTALLRSLELPPPDPPKDVSLWHFLTGYLAAYANGTFVDRDGTPIAKPAVDTGHRTIGNDTVTAFVSVVGEAFIDHFFYRHRDCVKFPIVVTADGGKAKWLTVGGGMPTFARVLGVKDGMTVADIVKDRAGLIEQARDGDEAQGLGAQKLKVIRLVGGVAGDESKIVSGMIVRNFGGMHLGQFVFAKWSIGDNETVSKVAETVLELLARRANQSVASAALYDAALPKDFGWIVDAVDGAVPKKAP